VPPNEKIIKATFVQADTNLEAFLNLKTINFIIEEFFHQGHGNIFAVS
jgi:hypothetical protein